MNHLNDGELYEGGDSYGDGGRGGDGGGDGNGIGYGSRNGRGVGGGHGAGRGDGFGEEDWGAGPITPNDILLRIIGDELIVRATDIPAKADIRYRMSETAPALAGMTYGKKLGAFSPPATPTGELP